MVRRHERSHVAPNAYVFPGGTVRDDDAEFVRLNGSPFDALSRRSDATLDRASALGLYVCAVRELFEEAGVLLARTRGELLRVPDTDIALQEQMAAARLALQARELSLAQLLDAWQWQPAFDALIPFSHWVTPAPLAVRFDTRFFVAEMPPVQDALHCTIETSEGIWQAPRRLLAGGYGIVFPTEQHLLRLAAFASVAALVAFARAKPIRRVQPDIVQGPSGPMAQIPADLVNAW